MSTFPSSPLIVCTSGSFRGEDIFGSTATLVDVADPKSGYYLIDGTCSGHIIYLDDTSSHISCWHDCVAVPVEFIENLQEVLCAKGISEEHRRAIASVFSCIRGGAASPLRKAAASLLEVVDFGREADADKYLESIYGGVAYVGESENRAAALISLAATCVEWIGEPDCVDVILDEAGALLRLGGTSSVSSIAMYAGEVAKVTVLDWEKWRALVTLAARSVAWASAIIASEDDM